MQFASWVATLFICGIGTAILFAQVEEPWGAKGAEGKWVVMLFICGIGTAILFAQVGEQGDRDGYPDGWVLSGICVDAVRRAGGRGISCHLWPWDARIMLLRVGHPSTCILLRAADAAEAHHSHTERRAIARVVMNVVRPARPPQDPPLTPPDLMVDKNDGASCAPLTAPQGRLPNDTTFVKPPSPWHFLSSTRRPRSPLAPALPWLSRDSAPLATQ